MRNSARFRIAVAGLAALLGLGGCSSVGDLQSQIGRSGYVLVYPAQSNLAPGQIWEADLTNLEEEAPPAAAARILGGAANFAALTKAMDASDSLGPDFNREVLGNPALFQAALGAAHVSKVDLKFGAPMVKYLALDWYADPGFVASLPAAYRQRLQALRADRGRGVVLASVLYVSGMTYTVVTTDKALFAAVFEKLDRSITGNAALRWTSATTATWTIFETEAIGVVGVSGDRLPAVRGLAAGSAPSSGSVGPFREPGVDYDARAATGTNVVQILNAANVLRIEKLAHALQQ